MKTLGAGPDLAIAMSMFGQWFRVIIVLGVSVAAVQAAAIEFIPKDKAVALAGEFESSRVPTKADLVALAGKELQCDMYGVRTRLQVERGVKLYMLSQSESVWKNDGAQVVPSYKLDTKGLIGHRGSVTDELRIDKDNKVIAQLSLEKPVEEKTELVVLAYSKCGI